MIFLADWQERRGSPWFPWLTLPRSVCWGREVEGATDETGRQWGKISVVIHCPGKRSWESLDQRALCKVKYKRENKAGWLLGLVDFSGPQRSCPYHFVCRKWWWHSPNSSVLHCLQLFMRISYYQKRFWGCGGKERVDSLDHVAIVCAFAVHYIRPLCIFYQLWKWCQKTPEEELSLFHKESGSFLPQQGIRKMEVKWCVSHLSRVISTNSLLSNVPFTSCPIPWQKGILVWAVATIPLHEPGQ